MGYLGAKKVPNLKNKPNFVKITKAGFMKVWFIMLMK